VWGDGLKTYATKVLDELGQILTSQARSSVSVPVPAEKVAEMLVELWRGSVKIVELL